MIVEKEPFGKTPDGTLVDLYTLTNNHRVKVKITNYGGIVVWGVVPDSQGEMGVVVFG